MTVIETNFEHQTYYTNYVQWLKTDLPYVLSSELMQLNEEEIKERFYKHLEFGTSGLRGELGVGTNRMNIFTIRRATQGLAQYLLHQDKSVYSRGVVIAYDCRHFSKQFAEEAALVLAASGIHSYVFDKLCPTPILSFAVRQLGAAAGIVITASHNPPEYNGYKVYGEDGGQIPPDTAASIMKEISKVQNELVVRPLTRSEALNKGLLHLIGREMEELYQSYLETLVLRPNVISQAANSLKIVYTPLHGTGYRPVTEILKRVGFRQVIVVPEQEQPDPYFSTVSTPNPEEKAAFSLAIRLAEKEQADLIIATDPDADRVGVVVQDAEGKYQVLTGSQTGGLLLDYILSQKFEKLQLPSDGVVLKTIVTSDLGRKIAGSYGLRTVDTLTGFKNIGAKIREYEQTGEHTFVFGYEESYGCLMGDFVRDKDGVQSCLMIAEMAAYYKSKGLTIYDALEHLYARNGYYIEDLSSITLKGIDGMETMKQIMTSLRKQPMSDIGFIRVKAVSDYLKGTVTDVKDHTTHLTGLPSSNVLKYILEDESWFAIRPSGTEPKLKIYFNAMAPEREAAEAKLSHLKQSVLDKIHGLIGHKVG